ncbi:hypothetical protein DOY81_004587 [Sarcophaga bullata]|nr:hypothetical protein DOY81_004587 [Sarcophaga bullata]
MSKIRPLPPFLQKVATEELNEDPERIEEHIQTLKTWIEQQPHLRARTDDQFLLAFLRNCKYNLEKVKTKIDNYYMLKTKCPDLFTLQTLSEDEIKDLLRLGVSIILPTPLHETGPRILLIRNGVYDPKKYTFMNIMSIAQGLNEILMLEDDYAIVNGYAHISDLKNWTKEHFFQMTPSMMKKLTVYSEEAVPLRPKISYLINAPVIFESIFNMIKPMMQQKQIDRMIFYGENYEKMYKTIPQKYLPKEYGGDNGSIPDLIVEWEKKFLSYMEYFKEDSKYGTDEHLRSGGPIDFDSLFGTDDSFKS